eukprot:TRINITY_DN67596_c0_g1_i1.p1 TRINITY_DN67596_c0_g1~~TRINITY_DN67596_c0_g1_i1.p1  ORF type:complete len:292 (+),score=40.42 TRINITY_DN67596_c0_g1_i1:2232-3107(+)
MKAAAALALLLGILTAHPVRAQSPALWVVKDADTTIYLLGSVHAMDDGADWLTGDLEKAYRASSEVVLEAVIGDRKLAEKTGLQYAHSNRRLRSDLPRSLVRKLEEALVRAGQEKSALDDYDPWYANIMMSFLALSGSGLQGVTAVEPVLQERAAQDGKKVIGLETLESQFKLFDNIPLDAQIDQLRQTLNNPIMIREMTEKKVECWRVGDLSCIKESSDREYGRLPVVREAILLRRNARWVPWFVERLSQPGTVLVAVGVDHLVGQGSLIEMLLAAGLKVERRSAAGTPN